VEAAGIDRLFTGDHVTFRGGQGFDGLLTATALAVAAPRLTVQTAVYLLPLRHSPCGTPAHIAESLRPYAEAGCRSFNLIPVADSEQAAIEGAAEVRALLGEKVR
jgi:hypothetical protein